MTDLSVLELNSDGFWQIYEAENPLAELLRKIVTAATDDAGDGAPLAFEDREVFE
ncbi:MAG: hypothetical protein ACRD40_04685 [Candidatus Acidiferrales bacterium]